MPPDFELADYLGFLTELGETGEPYFLEGGQAVNFWAEYFSAKGKSPRLFPAADLRACSLEKVKSFAERSL